MGYRKGNWLVWGWDRSELGAEPHLFGTFPDGTKAFKEVLRRERVALLKDPPPRTEFYCAHVDDDPILRYWEVQALLAKKRKTQSKRGSE